MESWTAIVQLAVPARIVLMIGWKCNPNHPDLEADGLQRILCGLSWSIMQATCRLYGLRMVDEPRLTLASELILRALPD